MLVRLQDEAPAFDLDPMYMVRLEDRWLIVPGFTAYQSAFLLLATDQYRRYEQLEEWFDTRSDELEAAHEYDIRITSAWIGLRAAAARNVTGQAELGQGEPGRESRDTRCKPIHTNADGMFRRDRSCSLKRPND